MPPPTSQTIHVTPELEDQIRQEIFQQEQLPWLSTRQARIEALQWVLRAAGLVR
jgi:hypothetical protein